MASLTCRASLIQLKQRKTKTALSFAEDGDVVKEKNDQFRQIRSSLLKNQTKQKKKVMPFALRGLPFRVLDGRWALIFINQAAEGLPATAV